MKFDRWGAIRADYHPNPPDRIEAGRIAASLVANDDFVVWDTETTDLHGCIIDVAVVDKFGDVLFDSHLNPQCKIEPGAQNVHGIALETLVGSPLFYEVFWELKSALHDKVWIVYNMGFDQARLCDDIATHYGIRRHYHDVVHSQRRIVARSRHCAMLLFAQFYGDLHHYYGEYRWQKLSLACSYFGIEIDDTAHSALGDAKRTLALINAMADWYAEEGYLDDKQFEQH